MKKDASCFLFALGALIVVVLVVYRVKMGPIWVCSRDLDRPVAQGPCAELQVRIWTLQDEIEFGRHEAQPFLKKAMMAWNFGTLADVDAAIKNIDAVKEEMGLDYDMFVSRPERGRYRGYTPPVQPRHVHRVPDDPDEDSVSWKTVGMVFLIGFLLL